MRKKRNDKKPVAARLFLCVLILVFAGLLAYSLYAYISDGNEELAYIRSETLYIVVGCALLLPLLIVSLLIHMAADKRRAKREKIEIEMPAPKVAIQQPIDSATKDATSAQTPAVTDKTKKADKKKENEGVGRFCMLTDIEKRKDSFLRESYDENVTLKDFCDSFRAFAASRMRLYYDIEDIRRFVAGMGVSHILILQGMSGTGKTSLAHAFGAFVENPSTIIAVQPMWKERTDLVGYYNEFTKKFNETTLLEKMYEANYSKEMYVTVLDEMNIARVEYYFAEFLSLLELVNPDERYLDVVSDKMDDDPPQLKDGRIKLPPNMWFVGTANNDDSTFAISDKVYDRAMVLNLDSKSEAFYAKKAKNVHIRAEKFEELVEDAKREYKITERNMRRLEELDKYLISHFHITFGNRIMRQILNYIPIYVSCGGKEIDALDDILSKKVIRKLETQNLMYVGSESEKLCAYLDELFGGKMTICKEHVRRIARNG